jgi:signal transduction histidine kinase
MSQLRSQIDALDKAFQQHREGNVQALGQVPFLLSELRKSADGLESRQQELATLYEVGQEMVSILKLDQLLESILDRAIVLVGADRGFLVLGSHDQENLNVAVARQFSSGEVDDAQVEISHGVIRRVLASREPVVTTNAQEDPRFQMSNSVINYGIRSVLAAPLQAREELIGAIYVDTRLSAGLFDEGDLALLSAMANHAAVAIQMARLYENVQTRNDELQKALHELQTTQDELIWAERLSTVGRMASGIIHDLKNPMTTIKASASLLGRSELSAERRERFSHMIVRSVDNLVEMTQEILDYARGGGLLSCREVQVEEFVDDLCTFIEGDFVDSDLVLRSELAYSGPILIDESKIRRALYNICGNARDAMGDSGTLTITTQPAGGDVEFRVSDTGPGIPDQVRDSLFEPFVSHGKASGTGLGLAIAKKTVEDHGGTISVQSQPGQGATFVLRLPAP